VEPLPRLALQRDLNALGPQELDDSLETLHPNAREMGYQDDVLMLRFNLEEFKDAVEVGESVQVKIMSEDGTAVEAYDSIRVIWP